MSLFAIAIAITIFAFVLSLIAQGKITSTYKKWAQVASQRGITGKQAAEFVLRAGGIDNVEVVATEGMLSDHYDPQNKRLALSRQNYYGQSIAALGVAAHEAGHALQDKQGYGMMRIRQGLVPLTMGASQLLPFVIFGGIFFHMTNLIYLGVVVYAILTLFQLVTLPVEFDASNRAKTELVGLGILGREEMGGVNATLNAAALTYVAAFISSLGNLLYMLALARGGDD